MILKVIVPAGIVPERAIVTKKTGQKPLILRHRLDIFDENGERKFINAQSAQFLVDPETGNANAIGDDVEVVWHVANHEWKDFLQIVGMEED